MRSRYLHSLLISLMIAVAGSGCVLKRNLGDTSSSHDNLNSISDPIYAPALLYTDGEVKSLATDGGKLYMAGRFSHVGPYTRSAPTVNLDTGAILTPSVKFETRVIETDGNGGYYAAGTPGIYESSSSGEDLRIIHVLADGAVDGSFSARFYGYSISSLKLVGGTLFAVGRFSGVYVGATVSPRNNLAALDSATGALTSFRYDLNQGIVTSAMTGGMMAPPLALEHSGNTLYIAGLISQVDPGGSGTWTSLPSAGMPHIIAIDDTSPAAGVPYNLWINGDVVDLQIVGSKLYMGGYFTSIQPGTTRMSLAALDISTPTAPVLLAEDPLGTATSFAITTGYSYLAVSGLASAGSDLFVTGIAGSANPMPMFVTKVTAGAATWVTTGLGTQDPLNYPLNAIAVSPAGDEVYASINNVNYLSGEHVEVQVFDATTGANSDLSFGDHPRLRVKSGTNEAVAVRALATSSVGSETHLHLGGHFSSIVQSRNSLAQVDLETSLLTTWDPSLQNGDTVYTVIAAEGTVYFGGSFSSVNNSTTPVTRWNLASVKASDASVLSMNPGPDGRVHKLHKIKNSIIAIGPFGYMGGAYRSRIGIINASTGALDTSWDPGFIYGGAVNFSGNVESTVVGDDLYFAAVDYNYSMSGGTSQAAIYRLSFSDSADPAITAYWPFQGNGQFSLSALPDQSGVLLTGLITAVGNQMVSTTYNGLMGFKTESLEPYAAASALSASFPLSSTQVKYAMDYMVRRGWVQKERYFLGGYSNSLFNGASDPWGLAVINLATGVLENPASASVLPTFQLTGSSADGMGIINDVLTVGNTTYVAGTFTSRQMMPGRTPATQTPYILTLKDGVWMEP